MDRDELDNYQEDEGAEEEVVGTDDEEELDEQTEQQKAETADTVRLFRLHPEVWIPYNEQVRAQLNIQAERPIAEAGAVAGRPETEVLEEETSGNTIGNLRDVSRLDAHHTSYPFLNGYEKTKIVSFRGSQLANGAKPFVQVPLGVTDCYEIAHMELKEKRLPFIIKRTWPDGSFEVWNLADLVVF
jgi:DNA-directed RNA polymerase I, II, and III subunit RPABC2